MNFMWLLIVLTFVAIVCTVFGILRDSRRRLPKCVVPFDSPCSDSIGAPRTSVIRKRHAKWISTKECEKLIHNTDNVVFIDIRSQGADEHFAVPGIYALSVSPNKLVDVMQWFPPDTCVVLCGEVDLCFSIVEPLDDDAGSTSIYLLKRNDVLSKAG
jgi:hypothetical protein